MLSQILFHGGWDGLGVLGEKEEKKFPLIPINDIHLFSHRYVFAG